MDSVGIQIAPVMGESLYEFSSHGNTGYSYATPLWQGKEERGYQSVAQDTATRRNDGQTREVTRRSTVSDVEIKTPVEEWNEPEDKKDFTSEGTTENGSQKQSQVASTLKWLTENYERAEGVCLPRCVLYTHYLDFCKKRKFTPAGAATFGKIIRQKFPKLTTRRLGTRGQSKYHYYGIGIKETSIYYHSVYSGKGLTRFSGIKIKTEGSNRKYSLSSKTGTLLPEFPDADNLILSDDIDRDKMQTFIMMYRTHCQRILDTVVSANFEEVQNFLLHFWQGMPEHLVELLKADMIADIVGLCDSILYKVLIDVLIPSTIQDLPESLGSEIKLFIKRLPYWLESSLENVPDKIIKKKMNVVKGFMQSIRRQISFVHLAQTARTVLLNHETINQMIEDVADINFTEICCQAGFMNLSTASKFQDTINEFFDEFINLLSKQAPIEAYTEWMDNIIDKCVLEKNKDNGHSFKDKASEFLLQWAIFGSLFMRDLTLHSASTFGSFHLIHMMFDEYVFLVMETQHDITNEKLLQKNIQKYMKNAEEIKMSAKIRPPNNKNNISPKHKKRKHSEDNYDSTDEPDVTRLCDENRPNISDSYTPLNGTAFSRPAPSNNRDQNSFVISDDPCRSGFHHSTLPLSPLKNFSSFNTGHYDRSSYLPQYGINSYNDYMNSSGSLGAASRVQGYADSHVQSFSSVPLNGGMHQSGSYWSDSRTHPSLHDPYNPYTYNKLHSSYESFNKSSFLRSGTYQDPFNRSAFDTSRSYYRGPHDNFQVGTHFPGLNGNYMDIAQPPSQYGRQETVIYQDDLYPGSMTSSFSSIGKPYLTCAPPFR